jgi:hypothetical protein
MRQRHAKASEGGGRRHHPAPPRGVNRLLDRLRHMEAHDELRGPDGLQDSGSKGNPPREGPSIRIKLGTSIKTLQPTHTRLPNHPRRFEGNPPFTGPVYSFMGGHAREAGINGR